MGEHVPLSGRSGCGAGMWRWGGVARLDMTDDDAEVGEAGDDDMPSEIDVELDVTPLAPDPFDTGALYVHTILRHVNSQYTHVYFYLFLPTRSDIVSFDVVIE